MTARSVDSATAGAAQLLGWLGVVLPLTELLGHPVFPVVVLDQAAHRVRLAGGDGPQLDSDTLAMWEWPQSAGWAPPSVCALSGVLVPARGSSGRAWRRALSTARSWRGFGPAAVIGDPDVVLDEVCRLEHAVHGIGLVVTGPGRSGPVVWAAPGRGPRARRRTADRWVEERLYQTALDTGLLDEGGLQ